jgi:CheY-like chemotaxis protein
VDPPGAPQLLGDANRIGQILVNLLGNGVKFTERGAVSLHLHWSANESGQAAVQFEVHDTGIGIRAADSGKVFEKFYRIDTPVGRQAGGTGLGLSISRLLAEAMGGSLTFASVEGQGSHFTLRLDLPLGSPSAAASAVPHQDAALLLAEPDMSKLLSDAWKSTGVEVLPFETLSAAIAHLDADGPCDLALLQAWTLWEPNELRQFFRTLALRGKVRCIRMRAPDGSASLGWTADGVIETIDFPLTPTKMSLALQRLRRETETLAVVNGEETAVPSREPIQPARILLVEDNVDSAAYARRVFERAGHQVTIAASVEEAVECAGDEPFDVIFMDLMLPDGSGFDATKRIRELEESRDLPQVPVVALTAHAIQGSREQAFAVTMDDYLTKPVRKDALLAAVRKWANPGAKDAADVSSQPAIHVDADLADLVPKYLERVNADLDRIGELVQQEKAGAIRSIGHNLKGSGGTYGFDPITRLGSLIELSAAKGNLTAAQKAAEKLKAYLRDVRWGTGS